MVRGEPIDAPALVRLIAGVRPARDEDKDHQREGEVVCQRLVRTDSPWDSRRGRVGKFLAENPSPPIPLCHAATC